MKRIKAGGLILISLLSVSVLARHNHAGSAASLKLADADFQVTSAGDAGPGSLRDAILAADRLSAHAHILVKAKRIAIETALPALVNPHGVSIDADPDAGLIDAGRLVKGAAMQINSPASALRGLTIVNSHDVGIVINAPGVTLDAVSILDSKVGVVLGVAAKGCAIRTSLFERDDTGITAELGVRDVVIASSIFRGATRAGFWFVGADAKAAAPDARGPASVVAPVAESVRIVDSVFEKNATGLVLANRPVLIQKSRFFANSQTAILILGGAARVEDNEIRSSGGTAISVTAGRAVFVTHNTLIDNPLTAIMVRDSEATIERNTLQTNGFGVIAVCSVTSTGALVRENLITKSTGDAITVIGGSPRLQHNQVTDNHAAGIRVLDLVQAGGALRATPQLEGNIVKGNGVDMPPTAIYKFAGVMPR